MDNVMKNQGGINPINTFGKELDYYTNTNTGIIFQKIKGIWVSVGMADFGLKGQAGDTGILNGIIL